jgi:hypothetical protein
LDMGSVGPRSFAGRGRRSHDVFQCAGVLLCTQHAGSENGVVLACAIRPHRGGPINSQISIYERSQKSCKQLHGLTKSFVITPTPHGLNCELTTRRLAQLRNVYKLHTCTVERIRAGNHTAKPEQHVISTSYGISLKLSGADSSPVHDE